MEEGGRDLVPSEEAARPRRTGEESRWRGMKRDGDWTWAKRSLKELVPMSIAARRQWESESMESC